MPGLNTALSLDPAAMVPRRQTGLWSTYLYLMVVSGALFPLRFIPINYEWIAIAGTIGITLYQIRRFGLGRLGDYQSFFYLILAIILYQMIKGLVAPSEVDLIQFLRSLYGQMLLALGISVIATSPLPQERFVVAATHVLLLLTVLVILSIISGFRLYATGFLPEAGIGDIQSEIASGNYRIITYYTTFIVFLLFINTFSFLKKFDFFAGIAAMAAIVLIVLTGTRSLIAPSLFILALLTLRQARLSTIAAFAIGLALLGGVIYLALPDIVDAYLSRFHVDQAFDNWRSIEQELALQAIGTAPIFGLAMGTPYTHVMSAMAGGTEGYTLNADYDLHNEYLWSVLYFGIVGSVFLISTVLLAIRSAVFASKENKYSVGFLCYLVVMLGAMNYSSALLKGYGALWFGIVIGICSTLPVSLQTTRLR